MPLETDLNHNDTIDIQGPPVTREFTFSLELVQKALEKDPFDPQSLIEALSTDETLKALFEADAGVWEGYSIQTHTRMVFNVFENFQLNNIPEEISLKLMRTLVAVHDIGKPLALKAHGNVLRQHEYTSPLVQKVLIELGFNAKEINLGLAIIKQDFLGNLFRGIDNLETVAQQITDVSKKNTHLNPNTFLKILKIYYMSDAGAYTSQAGKGVTDYAPDSLGRIFAFNPENKTMEFSANQTGLGFSYHELFRMLETAVSELADSETNITTPQSIPQTEQ